MIQKSPDLDKNLYLPGTDDLCGPFLFILLAWTVHLRLLSWDKGMGQLVPALYGCLYFCDDVVFLYGDLLQGGNKR